MLGRCRRPARLFVVGPRGYLRVALQGDPDRATELMRPRSSRSTFHPCVSVQRSTAGATAPSRSRSRPGRSSTCGSTRRATMHVVGGRGVLAVLLLLVTLPLAVRRRTPAATLLTAAGALVLGAFLVSHSNGVPVEVFLAMLLAFYSVGAHCDDRRSPVVGAVAVAAIAAADLARPGTFSASGTRPAAWLAFAIAWLVGRDLRRRRQRVADLEDRARAAGARARGEGAAGGRRGARAHRARAPRRDRARRQRDRRAGASGAASPRRPAACRRRLPRDRVERPRRARRAAPPARNPPLRGRAARDRAAAGARLAPVARRAGARVRIAGASCGSRASPCTCPPGSTSPPTASCRRRSPTSSSTPGDAAAEVVIRYRTRALELDVVDDGRGAATSVNGSGHGLIGMRERVALYGGTLEAGTRDGGGYAVRARLPLGDAT